MKKLAIIYDFDRTLSPKDMQEFHYMSTNGYKKAADFWNDCDVLKNKYNMDAILAYMLMMTKLTPNLTKQDLLKEGKYIKYYKGVETWFKRINDYGKKHNVVVEHYIISSGLRDIIMGTSIAKEFKKVYACTYAYDKDDRVLWPSRVINYTTKTQYLFRINKGVLVETNDIDLNRSTPDNEKYISFTDMIYIGDGMTDVPSMKVVQQGGGTAIAVYDPKTHKKSDALELKEKNRVDFMCEADYSKGSLIEKTIQGIIDITAVKNKLNKLADKK